MGKVTCAVCNKSCKSQAVRLDNEHYHLACFKCSLCEKSLASEGFFTKANDRYCVDDYRRLFGTHCDYCGEYVEGEVVTALNHTYHEDCFCCSLCKRRFEPGDRVTLTGAGGKHCLCADCDVENGDQTLDVLDVQASDVLRPKDDRPASATTEETSEEIVTPLIRETLSAPVTPARQLYNIEDNDEVTAGNIELHDKKAKMDTTSDRSKCIMSTPSGYKSDMSRSIDFLNGSYTSKERQLFSPIQNIMRYRSTSPGVRSPRTGCRSVSPGAISQKSRESTGSYNSKYDFSKFYHSSYLDIMDGQKEFKRGPSLNPVQKIALHYHRPAGSFSYTTARKDIRIAGIGNKQPAQVKKSFWQYEVVSKVDRQYLTALNKLGAYQPDDTQEPIQLSKIPDGKADEHRVAPIERADWPAPPAPAAAYPELLREHRERSRPEEGRKVEDKENCSTSAVVLEIDRKITELTKLTDSGAAQVILGDLKRLKTDGVALDPRSASRTPNAAVEPFFKTRYDSPVYASPSRDLDLLHDRSQSSLDHLYIERKYRTTPVPIANSSAIDGETSEKHIVRSNRQVPRPGYSLRPARPASSVGDYRHRSSAALDDNVISSPWRPRSTIDIGSDLHVFLADGNCCPITGLRHHESSYSNTNFGSNGYLGSQKSSLNLSHVVPGEGVQPKRVYPLEQLKKEVLPQGVIKESVERHLSSEDFVRVFGMNAEEFYRLPVWNRNDLKIRVGLQLP